MNIEIEHAHLESQAASGQSPSRRRSANDPQNQTSAPSHPTAERLKRAEPSGSRERVARQQVSPAQQAKEERHDGVSNLLGSRRVDVDEPEPEFGGELGVDSSVGGAEAENELVGPEPALGGAWEVREGVDEHGGGGLDLSVGEAAERHVLDDSDAGEGFLLQGTVIDAVEGDHRGERGRRRVVPVGHCSSGSGPPDAALANDVASPPSLCDKAKMV